MNVVFFAFWTKNLENVKKSNSVHFWAFFRPKLVFRALTWKLIWNFHKKELTFRSKKTKTKLVSAFFYGVLKVRLKKNVRHTSSEKIILCCFWKPHPTICKFFWSVKVPESFKKTVFFGFSHVNPIEIRWICYVEVHLLFIRWKCVGICKEC